MWNSANKEMPFYIACNNYQQKDIFCGKNVFPTDMQERWRQTPPELSAAPGESVYAYTAALNLCYEVVSHSQ